MRHTSARKDKAPSKNRARCCFRLENKPERELFQWCWFKTVMCSLHNAFHLVWKIQNMCYITIRPSETNIKVHSLGLFHNTRVILFLLLWCDAGWCFLCRNFTRPPIINVDQSAQIEALSQASLLQLHPFCHLSLFLISSHMSGEPPANSLR